MEQLEWFKSVSESEASWCQKFKVNILTPLDKDYPDLLKRLPYRPQNLFYWGTPVWNTHPLISVVGSRDASPHCLEWMEDELGAFLNVKSVAVVSGGARGVDQKAHQIALRKNRPTVVFLPSGLGHVYPSALTEWIPAICASGGAVVSQFLPSQQMHKGFFRQRNQLIAAISPVTLVIEAKRRSGTMLTAEHAAELDRTVAVLPTFPTHCGMGGLDLLADGAMLIRDALDLSGLYNFPKLDDGKN